MSALPEPEANETLPMLLPDRFNAMLPAPALAIKVPPAPTLTAPKFWLILPPLVLSTTLPAAAEVTLWPMPKVPAPPEVSVTDEPLIAPPVFNVPPETALIEPVVFKPVFRVSAFAPPALRSILPLVVVMASTIKALESLIVMPPLV